MRKLCVKNIVIVAPHPDDEWIGCGCWILEALKNNIPVKVLIITRCKRTERRIKISKQLAKKYKYSIKILGENELEINKDKLYNFLKKEIKKDDILYIPDIDSHPDHCLVSHFCSFFPNILVQYCVYNNSKNLLIRLLHKFLKIITREVYPSFKYRGEKIFYCDYKHNEKMRNIKKFGETPRAYDWFRLVI